MEYGVYCNNRWWLPSPAGSWRPMDEDEALQVAKIIKRDNPRFTVEVFVRRSPDAGWRKYQDQ